MGERRGTKGLELWCKKMTEGYPGVKVENMTTSWRDGLAFCAMIHHFRPELIDFSKLNKHDVYSNNELAFRVAEQYLGIPALLEPEDMVEYPVPDRLSILTYLSQFYQAFAVSHGSSPSRVVPKRPATAPDRGIVSPASTSPPTKMAVRSGGVNIGMPRREPCAKCGLPVFIAERLNVGKQLYHRTCFRCARCNSQLTLQNYYETETENQFCCETCPDEEMVAPKEPVEATNPQVITRSLSDEEKSAGLKIVDQDDYSCMFETALDYSDFNVKSSDDTTEFTKARSHFINALLESSDEEDLPPDLPKSKPPQLQVSDTVNPIVNTNIQSSVDSEPLKTHTVESSVNNNHSVSVSNQQKTASLELDKNTDIVTKENVQQNTSLVQARMRLFQGNILQSSVPLKHSKSNNSDISVNLSSRRIKEDVVQAHSLPSKENNTEVIILDSSDSVIVVSDDSIIGDNKQYNQDKREDLIEDEDIITITDESLVLKDNKDDKSEEKQLDSLKIQSAPDIKQDIVIEKPAIHKESSEEIVKNDEKKIFKETPPNVENNEDLSKSRTDIEVEIKDNTEQEPLESKNEEKPPETKNQEEPPETKNEEEPPETKNEEEPREIKNEEGPSEIKKEEVQPEPKDDEEMQSNIEEEQPETQIAMEIKPNINEGQLVTDIENKIELSAELTAEVEHTAASNIPLEKQYPDDLNPFGDDEPSSYYEKSLNPFSDDEEEDEQMPHENIHPKPSDYALKGSTGETPESLTKCMIKRISINPFDDDPDEEDVKPVPLPRKVLAPKMSLNPFWDDPSRDRSSFGLSAVSTPEPRPRTSAHSLGSFGSSTSISSGTSSVASRKKKAAPRPPIPTFHVSPQHSVNSSPSSSVHHSPRLRKNKRAPLPPTSTPFITRDIVSNIDCSPISDNSTLKHNVIRTNENISESLNLSVISPTSSIESGEYEKEKVVKDEVNRNRQSQTSYIQSPDKSFQITAPDKSTYGKWKRKKGQAPSRPIPQKRTIKALPIAEVRRELDLIEVQQQGLEKQGVRLEQIIRERCEGPNADPEGTVSIEVEDLILQLFEVVNEKNELCRRQAELMYLQRQHRLEEEHAEVEYQIRCLMLQPEANKTDSDKAREEELISRLVDIVERRNEIIECLEMDRVREAEEDDSICTSMNSYASKRDECSTPEITDSPKKKDKNKFKKKFKLRSSQKLDMDKDVDESESANSSIVVKEKDKKKKKFNLF